tara:strand:- start:603 stop:905 length:303 start_codon:yes stop_codon:yes gene_type:complete
MAFGNRGKNRRGRRLSAFRGGKFNPKRLSPRRKRQLERRRSKFFEEKLDLDKVRRSNKKRALFSTIGRKGTNYKSRILERHPKGRTIIDVMKILKANSNN